MSCCDSGSLSLNAKHRAKVPGFPSPDVTPTPCRRAATARWPGRTRALRGEQRSQSLTSTGMSTGAGRPGLAPLLRDGDRQVPGRREPSAPSSSRQTGSFPLAALTASGQQASTAAASTCGTNLASRRTGGSAFLNRPPLPFTSNADVEARNRERRVPPVTAATASRRRDTPRLPHEVAGRRAVLLEAAIDGRTAGHGSGGGSARGRAGSAPGAGGGGRRGRGARPAPRPSATRRTCAAPPRP